MKKSIIILLIILSNVCFANKADTTQSIFYEDSTVMNDLTKEKDVVSNMMKAIGTFSKSGARIIRTDGKAMGIPVNEEQLISLLKCLNVAAESKGKLLIVFRNKENGKLLNINNSHLKFENSQYQLVGIEQFHQLLRAQKVDFKLKKVDGKFISPSDENKFMSDFYMNKEKKEYIHATDMLSGNYPIIFEELNIDINVSWKKDLNRGKTNDEKSEIKDITTITDCSFLGQYSSNDEEIYSKDNLLIGETKGIYEIPVELNGHAITLRCLVRTMTIINKNSGSGQIYAELYKFLL